jgi:hypothetical protein
MEWEAKKGLAIDGNSFAQSMANLISNVISGEKTFSPSSPKAVSPSSFS